MLDIFSLKSRLMRDAASKIVSKAIRNKIGCDVGIHFNSVQIAVADGEVKVHLDADADIKKEELIKLLEKLGMG